MDNLELEKSKAFKTDEIIDYVPNSVVSKSIIKKSTGNIKVVSFDKGEVSTSKNCPFDTFVQIIDGKADIVIDGIPNLLDTGQSIVVPAHSSNIVKAKKRFKMILTTIKSLFE
jgi:quercetin dioxygenase-like cupin family protein